MGASSSSEANKPEIKLKPEININGNPRIPLDKMNKINESSVSICKLTIKEINESATGFFLSDISKNKFLITNNHVISENVVESNMTIIIEIYDKNKYELKLNKNERYIKLYENILDIAIIKINDMKDLCSQIKFLFIDLNYKMGYNIYLKKDIYLLGYPYGKDIELSKGQITNIGENEFKHDCSTDNGLSGSPIILSSNNAVIGIHKAGIIKEKINVGTFLGTIFNQNDCLLSNDNQEQKIVINISSSLKKKSKRNKKMHNKNSKNSKSYANIILNDKKEYSTQSKRKNNYDNKIISEFYIKKNEENKDIRIINSYEAFKRSLDSFSFK